MNRVPSSTGQAALTFVDVTTESSTSTWVTSDRLVVSCRGAATSLLDPCTLIVKAQFGPCRRVFRVFNLHKRFSMPSSQNISV